MAEPAVLVNIAGIPGNTSILGDTWGIPVAEPRSAEREGYGYGKS